MSSELQASEAPKPANAASLARDGQLYLAISIVALGATLLAVRLSSKLESFIAFFGMACAAWLVLCGLGLYKLTRARQLGHKSFMTAFGSVALWIYLLFVMVVFCAGFLPHQFRSFQPYEDLIAWSVPSALTSALVLWRTHRRMPAEETPFWRGMGCLMVCYIALTYVFGLITVTEKRWLLTGAASDAAQNSTSLWWFNTSGPWLNKGFAALRVAVVIATIIAVASYAFTLKHLYTLRRRALLSGSARWLLFAAWVCLALLSVLGLLLLAPDPAIYAGGLGVVFSLSLAAGCAALITRSWREYPPLCKRRILTLALSLVFLSFIPIAGSILLLSYTSGRFWLPELKPKTWLWNAPEVLRAPIARNMARWSKRCDYFVYSFGLASAEDLKARALAGVTASNRWTGQTECAYNWRSWSERDRAGALAVALAVPAASSSPVIPQFNYDYGAGFVVGLCGDDETVRQRLNGKYSNQFMAGMIVGLAPGRLREYGAAIETVLADRTWRQEEVWSFSSHVTGHHLRNALLTMIQNASPLTYTRLESAMQNYGMWSMPDIRIAALTSPDPLVRKLIIYSTYSPNMMAQEQRLMLECAEGHTRNADADERRLAALRLNDNLLATPISISFSTIDVTSPLTAPPVVPLTDQEEKEIDAICAKAHEILDGGKTK